MTATSGRFVGQRALVVGGGAEGPARYGESLAMGNGRAIAQRLAAKGAEVAVTDIDLARARATVDALADRGLAIESGTSDPAECRAAVTHARAEESRGGKGRGITCNARGTPEP